MSNFPMTVAGAEALKAELHELKNVARPKVVADIAEARAHGDLKENAEYHAAKEEQGFIEGRIREIEAKIGSAQIIDVTKMDHDGKIVFGATVKLVNLDTDEEITYQLVGEDEADAEAGKIFVGSPLARALIGKYAEDEVVVKTPAGEVTYDVLEVFYI